jgi:hypothetical protein
MAKFRIHEVTDIKEELKAIDVLREAFNCWYDQIQNPRHFVMNVMFDHNPQLWPMMWDKKAGQKLKALKDWTKTYINTLPSPETMEYMARKKQLVRKYCQLYPFQVVKIVRMRVQPIEEIIADPK